MIHYQLLARSQYTNRLRNLFSYLDSNCDGTVDFAEFVDHFEDESLQALLAGLNLETYDAPTLFRLMDRRESNGVTAEEFVEGCLRLKGVAQSIQVAKMREECREAFKEILALRRDLRTQQPGSAQ